MADEDLSGSPVAYDERIDITEDAERILRKLGLDYCLDNQQYYDRLVPPLVDTSK
jgi:hypothetical protein